MFINNLLVFAIISSFIAVLLFSAFFPELVFLYITLVTIVTIFSISGNN
jgi:hypothetical protein